MALPKIDVPKFDLTLPGTKETYEFRPFLVKENNILTQAAASEDILTQLKGVVQIVENCCMGNLKVESLPLYQIQWLFLQLKARSVGEEVDFILTCGECEAKINYQMNLNDYEIKGDNSTTKKVMINEKSGLVFRMPDALTQVSAADLTDLEVIMRGIDHIFTDEEIIHIDDIEKEELVTFIEQLPLQVIKDANEFYSNVPVLMHIKEFNCSKCNTENRVLINSIEHFFA